jgi:hypothetical protein
MEMQKRRPQISEASIMLAAITIQHWTDCTDDSSVVPACSPACMLKYSSLTSSFIYMHQLIVAAAASAS